MIRLFSQAALLAILVSCSNQKEASQQPIQDTNNIEKSNKAADSLNLRFTTGIRSIYEDSKGNFWFGSHNEGVARYNGKTITYFNIYDGLSHNQVRHITEDSFGQIWFDCGVGISMYNGIMFFSKFTTDYTSKDDWKNSPNDIWFKGNEMSGFNKQEGRPGAYRFDGRKFIYQAFPMEPDEYEPSYYSVTSPVLKGMNDIIWFATYGAVIGYDGEDFIIIGENNLKLNDGYLHIRSLFEDSYGNLWIGNNGIGVLKYDGDTIVNFSQQTNLVAPDSKYNGSKSPQGTLEHVFAINEDKEGNIWFGDRDTGAWRYDGKSFKNFTTDDGLSSNHLYTIYKDRRDDLWYGLADGGVFKYDGESFYQVF